MSWRIRASYGGLPGSGGRTVAEPANMTLWPLPGDHRPASPRPAGCGIRRPIRSAPPRDGSNFRDSRRRRSSRPGTPFATHMNLCKPADDFDTALRHGLTDGVAIPSHLPEIFRIGAPRGLGGAPQPRVAGELATGTSPHRSRSISPWWLLEIRDAVSRPSLR